MIQKTLMFIQIAVLVFFLSQLIGHGADNQQELDLAAIVQSVKDTYKNLEGYASSGEIITEMDMSNVDATNIPGAPQDADITNSPLFKSMMQQKQIIKHTFDINLSRNGDYRIEWDQNINELIRVHGAAWSTKGMYKMKISNPMMPQPVMEQKDRMLALATATGVSGGAANTVPSLFYDLENEILTNSKDLEKLNDEQIDGVNCYVLFGKFAGQQFIYWIDKDSFLLKQRKQIIGPIEDMPEITDEEIKKGLEAINQEITPESMENMRNQMKNMPSMLANVKGFILETHSTIKLNPKMKPEDFIPSSEQ